MILYRRLINIRVEKKENTDSVIWQKPPYQQNCHTGKMTTQTKPQKIDYTAMHTVEKNQIVKHSTNIFLHLIATVRRLRALYSRIKFNLQMAVSIP